jgi:hypothetical protein
MSEVLGALSTALDLTEGQPAGHAARSCLLGMRLAKEIRLPSDQSSDLFYALLLKDLGCSSNAAKMSYLFGADDRTLKRDVKTINWQKLSDNVRYVFQSAKPGASRLDRIMQIASLAIQGPKGPRQLVKIRCERGAQIAKEIGFSSSTCDAILDLDEHWNGGGTHMENEERKSRYWVES